MLDQFRAQKLEWNRANNQIYDRVETSSGDSNGRTLFVQISNGGTVEDLTGATLSLAWNKKTEQGLESFEEVDAKKGQYRLFYPTGMLVNHGVLQASLVLVDVTGRIESKPFDIIVHKGTVDDEAVESDNKFTALTTALVKVSQVQAEFDSLYAEKSLMMDTLHDDKKADMEVLETDYSNRANTLESTYAPRLTEAESEIDMARGGASTLGERLNEEKAEVTAQLAETTSELLNISNRAIMQHKAVSVAHRGLNGLAPENTVPAFELACQYGFWGLETDVRQTSDGHFALYHDATLDTITTGTGTVEDSTLEYIRSLSFKSGGRYENYPNLKIATLEEYLTIAVKYDMHCVIEVTSLYGGALDRVLDIVYSFGMQYKSIMLGAPYTINYIRDKDKQIAVGLVTWGVVTEDNLDFCASIKPCMMGVAGSANFLTKEYVELAHSKGVAINTYIINNYAHYLEQIEWGVDIVTTDYILGGSAL